MYDPQAELLRQVQDRKDVLVSLVPGVRICPVRRRGAGSASRGPFLGRFFPPWRATPVCDSVVSRIGSIEGYLAVLAHGSYSRLEMTPKLHAAVLSGQTLEKDPAKAAKELRDAIWQEDAVAGFVFCSPQYDRQELAAALTAEFGDLPLVGCTTAGEIGPKGFSSASLSAFTLSGKDFAVETRLLLSISDFDLAASRSSVDSLMECLEPTPGESGAEGTFGFLLVDGLSIREEGVIGALHAALGDTPLFGGSAGDDLAFQSTWILHGGKFHGNAGVLSLIHTKLPFRVFKSQHFVPTDVRMVVTEADAPRRTVIEINGGPAAEEYAKAIGLQIGELTPQVFSTHPVVVRVGGSNYVRSIQQVNPDGSLVFYCAIDEGLVLTVARGVGLLENLRSAVEDVREAVGPPLAIITCDCILRRLEIEQRGIGAEVDAIVKEHNLIGFSTYGEQYNAMHVNQTVTGVAIGQPRSEDCGSST